MLQLVANLPFFPLGHSCLPFSLISLFFFFWKFSDEKKVRYLPLNCPLSKLKLSFQFTKLILMPSQYFFNYLRLTFLLVIGSHNVNYLWLLNKMMHVHAHVSLPPHIYLNCQVQQKMLPSLLVNQLISIRDSFNTTFNWSEVNPHYKKHICGKTSHARFNYDVNRSY